MRHFSLPEFEASQIATRRGMDNRVPATLAASANRTLAMLEGIRARLCDIKGTDVPVILSSGYRCPALNLAVGGSANSDHMLAAAADWTAPAFGAPYEVCVALWPHASQLGIGQLIHEFGRWVHTSHIASSSPINRVITISAAGTVPGIVRV